MNDLDQVFNELKKAKQIGILGGSFNPPHIGHFIMAETAKSSLMLDYILFIPTGKIMYKEVKSRASGIDRYNMLKAVVELNPGFRLTNMEIAQTETTYTSNTLSRLKRYMPDTKLYFIVGADSLDYMDKWYKPESIFDKCTVVVMKRNHISEDRMNQKIDELRDKFSADILVVDMPSVEISSSVLRDKIQQGISVKYLVDDVVLEYIKKHNLYRE